MLDLNELKARKDIVNQIDWDITPQEAFETYQIKSINAWKQRSLPDLYYFLIYVYKSVSQVLLVKRSLKDSEEIAEIAVPESLVSACVTAQGGDQAPHGQYFLDDAVRTWLQKELNV